MFKRLVILCSLAGLLAAAVASAQNQVSDGKSLHGILNGNLTGGIYRADSTGRLLTTDTNGNLLTYSMGMTPVVRAGTTPIISKTQTTGSSADSATVNVQAYTTALGLLIGTNAGSTRYAVSVRYALNAATDSSSLAPIPGKVFVCADSTVSTGVTPTATVPGDCEFQVYIVPTTAAGAASQPKLKYIPLFTSGGPIWLNDVNIRVRPLTSNASSITTNVYLVGVHE